MLINSVFFVYSKIKADFSSSQKEEEKSIYYTATPSTMENMKMYFFKELHINPICIHVTTHSGTGSANLSQRLPMRGKLLGNIDNCVINFDRLTLSNPFVSKEGKYY